MDGKGDHEPCIFLCHAKEDKSRLKELYHQLKPRRRRSWIVYI
jgi:uncharacterized protein YdeI (YjbR/CyaY-like superfamily)